MKKKLIKFGVEAEVIAITVIPMATYRKLLLCCCLLLGYASPAVSHFLEKAFPQ